MLRLWPLAALVVLLPAVRHVPRARAPGHHAAAGDARVPRDRRDGGRAWLIGALVLLVVPGTLYRVDELRKAVNAGRQPFFLTDGEYRALS